jgi:hypothetical protein
MKNSIILKSSFRALMFFLFLDCSTLHGDTTQTVNLPITLEYSLIKSFVANQLFTDPGGSALVTVSNDTCSRIELKNPVISPEKSLIKISSDINVRLGFTFFGNCVKGLTWSGKIDVLQSVQLDEKGWNIRFKTVDSRIYSQGRRWFGIPQFILDKVKANVPPFMDQLNIDLTEPLQSIKGTLPMFFSSDQKENITRWLDSIRLDHLLIEKDVVKMDILMEIDAPPETKESAHELSSEEIVSQTAVWESLDDYLVYELEMLVGHALTETEKESLMEILLQNRYEFVNAFAGKGLSLNLVREQFVSSWEGISLILRKYLISQSSASSMEWLSFFTTSDAIVNLYRRESAADLTISRDGLIQLAKILRSFLESPGMEYSYELDPKLRQTLELGPALDDSGPKSNLTEVELSLLFNDEPHPISKSYWKSFWIPSAFAAEGVPADLKDAGQWAPPSDQDFFPYMEKFKKILDEASDKAIAKNALDEKYHSLYRVLIPAMAWQESCWRQFVKSGKKLQCLVSYNNSSLGAMQINQRVWRGVYKVDSLRWNPLYNVCAGSEIADYYLRRYALKKMDPANPLEPDTLARVVYAMYNGGPGEFKKFLERSRKNSFYESDQLFFEKYLWSKEGKFNKLSLCLLGKELEAPADLVK